MSDSDDTDVLLIIPPNFFSVNETDSASSDSSSRIYSHNFYNLNSMSKDFTYPQSRKHSELDDINARISHIERRFCASSDISTISNCTVKTQYNEKSKENNYCNEYNRMCSSPIKFNHSTPKQPLDSSSSSSISKKAEENIEGNEVLKEIDQYFKTKTHAPTWRRSEGIEPAYPNYNLFSTVSDKMSMESASKNVPENYEKKKSEQKLISLQDLWEAGTQDETAALQEERLRRQHCERTIKALQEKLLEYQQKISVAIQIDSSKNAAIEELKVENLSIRKQATELTDKIHILEGCREELSNKIHKEKNELKSRTEYLERELRQALDLVSSFQNKNEALEIKVDELNKAYAEVEDIYKRQITDLEKRVKDYQQLKEIDTENLTKIKNQLNKIQEDKNMVQMQKVQMEKHCELLQGEIELLKQQKSNSYEKFKEEKDRATLLDRQNKNFQETITQLLEKEKKTTKEFETLRTSLKTHYQQQLEQVVSQKLKEFQTQLDYVEESLKSEAKDRECLIAERALRQIEQINEKNEQEITLLTEKHHEEVGLYRLQLLNASKKINDLEEKLNIYRSRRADIAEKLHNVMETQWKKALEILTNTSPNIAETVQVVNPQNLDHNKLDGIAKEKTVEHPENELFETPTSSRSKKNERSKSKERLHNYIEMLLNKSPKDFENLEEILDVKNFEKKDEKYHSKINALLKPPWK